MKRVLITGGAGFIGSKLALKLKERNYSVFILDTLSPQIHNEYQNEEYYKDLFKGITFIKGDVTSENDWKKVIYDVDAIVHLAAETGTGQSMYEINRYSKINIGGTAIMLDILASEKTDVKKIIVASSRAVYGEGKYISNRGEVIYPHPRSETQLLNGEFDPQDPLEGNPLTVLPTDEDSMIRPSSVYGVTKYSQEQLIMTTGLALGIAPVALRYQNVYGPGQSLSNPYTGILSIFSTQMRNGNQINIFEDGKESRDFVYIDDVVDATILSLESEAANGEIFNVGSGCQTDVLTVANLLKKYYAVDVPVVISGKYRKGDIRHNFADIKKIREILKFNPKVNFELGIEIFTKWVLSQDLAVDTYEESIKQLEKRGLFK